MFYTPSRRASSKSATAFLLSGKLPAFNASVGEKARADARIILEGIKNTTTQARTSEANYVVWQNMVNQGSTAETLALPSFSGPKKPTFSAPGGLIVQIPDGNFKSQIQTLSAQPGMGYLNDLAARKDVNWQPVKLAYETWNYQQSGLTQAGAALVAVAVTWATGGTGAGLVGAVDGTMGAAMANAAFSSLAAQASISLINNKGDIGKTLQELGSSQTIKATVAAILTAGVLDKLGATATMKDLSGQTGFSEKLTYNLINATGRALTNTAINGGNLEDALKQALVGGLVDTAHGQAASQIKGLESQYLAHKLAHALAGCVAGAAAGGACKDGAIGGAVGEIVAEMFKGQKPAASASAADVEAYNQKVLGYSKLVAGAMSAYAGGNAQTAITTAETAVRNNFLTDKQWNDFSKKLASCGTDKTCEATARSEYLQLSKQQDAQLATCDTRGDCDTLRNNVLQGRDAMLQLVNTGKLPVAYAGAFDMQYMGQKLANDATFRKQVGNAVTYMNWCTANPSACNKDQLQKAMGLSMMVLGPVIAANSQLVAAILFAQNGERASSAVIGGGVNALAQGLSSGKFKPEDVLKAAATAYATAGANLATTMAVNVGAEGMVSWAKNDSASEAMSNMLLSAAGTAVGFKVGDLTKGQFAKMTDSFSATMKSKPTGFLTIEGPYSRSILPSTLGNMAGSGASEAAPGYFQSYIDQFRLAGAAK